MAFEIPVHKISETSGADLTAGQFRFVKYSAGAIVLSAAGTDQVAGVLNNKPNTGEVCEIMTLGTSKMVAGAAVAKGAVVMSDAQGRAVTGTSTNYGQGIAMEAASAAGELIAVELRPFGILP